MLFRTAVQTVFHRRSAPLFCCFIEFTSSFRSLHVLDNKSSCWPMARNWNATSVFGVADSLFSDIFWICKIWLVAKKIYILTTLMYHTKISRFFTLISSLRLLPLNLVSFGSFGTKFNKSKSLCFAAHSNHDFQTQEAIKILKTKQNKTTNTISRVAMQIRTNYGRYEDAK